MSADNLRQFIRILEEANELKRVRQPVDSYLEISEITDRVSKEAGPALLFENVKGFDTPLLINAFGSFERMNLALGVRSIEEVVSRLTPFFKPHLPKGTLAKLKSLWQLKDLLHAAPQKVRRAPCQEVVITSGPFLSRFPILQCWPGDAGRYITFPLVFTKDLKTGKRNVGVYRMQVMDDRTTGMHWQIQKDGSSHHLDHKRTSRRMPVAVVIGADPITCFSGVCPLPLGMDEIMFSGFLRKKRVRMVRCRTSDLEVPAESEIVLEGYVDSQECRIEGPFGDHTGFYSPPDPYPVFHITCITHRKNPVYHTTIVGKPPQEDYYMGKAIERIFIPAIQTQLPEIVDMNFPMEGVFNHCVIVSIKKNYPGQARKTAHALWGLGQLMFTKVVVVVEDDTNVHNVSEVAWRVFNNMDPTRDIFFVEGPTDSLNHATQEVNFGSKMGIDATRKMKEEGYSRPWPEEIRMSDEVKAQVTQKWESLGLKRDA